MSMKRALILDGAGAGDPTTEALCEVVSDELDAAGLASSVTHLRDLRLAHCQGEFDCWVKTPGLCRADDEARDIARDLHDSDLAVYLGPVTFGGYAPELKKALDRQICLVEPFFEERAGRLHHRARYDRYPALLALGWLPAPDPAQERLFSALLEANAINGCAPRHRALVVSPDPATWPGAVRAAIAGVLRPGHEPEPDEAQLESASFRLRDLTLPDRAPAAPRPIRRAALLVGSARPRGASTSESLGHGLLERLEARGVATELYPITPFVHGGLPAQELARRLLGADLLILASPLYFDSFPFLVTRALVTLAAERAALPPGASPPAFLALLNCGFPEAEQNALAVAIARSFARSTGLRWAGGLALGGGEAIHGRPVAELGGMGRNIARALDLAAASLAESGVVSPEAAAIMAKPLVPRWIGLRLGSSLGNLYWVQKAREHGLRRDDLEARPLDAPPSR